MPITTITITVTLNKAKVAADEKFDGKWVLITNTDLPADEVALRYKELWMVERVFRERRALSIPDRCSTRKTHR